MSYVDGFVIPVKKSKVKAYQAMARWGLKAWRKHGVLDYKECVGDDLKMAFGLNFPKGLKLKKDETVFFSFIVYKSKAHRDRVNRKVMKDMESSGMPTDMPFDPKRMMVGGFKTLVE